MAKPISYTSSVAMPMPHEEMLRRVIGERYSPDQALNAVKMCAGTDDMYPALIGMVQAISSTAGIDAKHREVIILRSAAVPANPYEWQADERMAANAGLNAAEIEALAADGPVTGIDEEHVLLCIATDELSRTATPHRRHLDPPARHLRSVLARKYIATIGWFNMLSLFLNGCRVPLETTDKIGSRTSPL